MKLLGFEIKRSEDELENQPKSFAEPINDDGAVNIGAAGGSYGFGLDLNNTARTESELVTRYRQMANNPEVQQAVDEIINEMISVDSHEKVVEIVLDNVNTSDKVKKLIQNEFESILKLLDFSNNCYDIAQKFYVDGRLNYHIIVDENKPKEGIKELRYLDPRKIRLIREIEELSNKSAIDQDKKYAKIVKNEYYIYSDEQFGINSLSFTNYGGVRIAKDSIARITSGLVNENNTAVLSYLDSSYKPLNQLRMLEDATVIYTIVRSPERRIFYVDVGSLPKAKAEQYLYDMMARHKNKLTYDPASGNVTDQRKMMCYALDTKIPLLDGRTLELKDLISEYESGKLNWVYSCDPKTGKFYPGPVSWAGITKTNAEVVRVTFDNNKSVVCTPDHKFPVWGKGFVEAQHLTTEDSIIPGYRRNKIITDNNKLEYEQIYKNETGTWEYTHREVEKWKEENNLKEEFVFNDDYKDLSKKVIHHKNYNNKDNSPENLVLMNYKDHLEFHRNMQNILYMDSFDDQVEYCAKHNMSVNNIINYINSIDDIIAEWIVLNKNRNPKNRDIESLSFTYKDLNRIIKSMGYKDWTEFSKIYDETEREPNGRKIRSKFRKGSKELGEYISEKHKGKVYSFKTWKIKTPNGSQEIIENLNEYCRNHNLNRSNIKGKYGSKGYFAEKLKNHKILSVEKLEEKIVVGSISIDNNETYHSHHTYLLEAGVYTKNTMTEDYWFPRRAGNRATEVESLPGSGQLLGNDNLQYFQNKLYKSLNVPIGRLQPETMYAFGRSSEMSREEVKFSKFIRRLRNRFSILFDRILEKQLILKGILSPTDWNMIKNNIQYDFMKDNYFEELKELEILAERFGRNVRIDGLVICYHSRNVLS
jgi:hypothetical protein